MQATPKRPLDTATVSAIDALDRHWAMVDAAREKIGLVTVLERPEGGITIPEYAERYGVPKTTAAQQLNRMVDEGVMLRFAVKMPNARGHLVGIAVFAPCQNQ